MSDKRQNSEYKEQEKAQQKEYYSNPENKEYKKAQQKE